MVDDGTHSAGPGGEWLAATLGGGDVTAGGTDARNSTNNDTHSDDDDNSPAATIKELRGPESVRGRGLRR